MVSQAVPTPIRLSRACSTLSPKTTSVVVPGRIEVANGLRSALQNTGLAVSTGLSPGVAPPNCRQRRRRRRTRTGPPS